MDGHDHKDCEDRLSQLHAALMRSEQLALAGRFAGSVMHEVNGPLEALGNLVYLADQDAANSEMVRFYLRMAEVQLLHVQNIARRTLSFYRSHARTEAIDVVDVLDAALQMQQPQISRKGIDVRRRHSRGERIEANAGELLQIFTNLISNAVQALKDEGTLHLRVSRSGEYLHIVVADNGCGIPEEQRKTLFMPFSTSNKERGTGLGLWTSKTLVEKHRGRIRHRSSTGPMRRGTAFRVSFPVGKPQQGSREEPE